VSALVVAQEAASGGADTAVVVAAISAVGVVLAALVTVIGQRSGSRLDGLDRRIDGVEKHQEGLLAAVERLEADESRP
jgi:hypothetical protein